MEKTQRKQSLNCLSNTPKLFDLKELLSSLKITPGQMGNMKGLIYIEGLTEKQVRQKLSHAKIIGTNRFGFIGFTISKKFIALRTEIFVPV